MEMVYGKEVLGIVINMKVNMLKIKKRGMEFLNGRMEIYTRGIFLMIKNMDTVKCTGMMDLVIKVNGKMVYNLVKV